MLAGASPFYFSFQGSNAWYLKLAVLNTRWALRAGLCPWARASHKPWRAERLPRAEGTRRAGCLWQLRGCWWAASMWP